MIVVLFRSKLTAAAGEDYAETAQALKEPARKYDGFVDIKSFTAEDGERLTVVRWKDLETLKPWRDDAKHMAANAMGRQRWYEYYNIEIATIVDQRSFART